MEEINNEIGLAQILRGDNGVAVASGSDAGEKTKIEQTQNV
jgi:hypothetical protein